MTSLYRKVQVRFMRAFENKIKYKIFKIGMLLLVLGMIVIACGIRDNSSYAVQPGNNATENNEQEKTDYKDGNAKIQVYTMDPDSLEAEEITVKVNADSTKGLTAQTIVDAVMDLFEAQGANIGINQVEQNENTVIVDFNGEKAPVVNVGSAEETAILNCISMSLLDNLDDCQQVVFHVDGDCYESGHYAFELNEAYKWKN